MAKALDLLALECGVDPEDLERLLVGELITGHADDDAFLLVPLALIAPGSVRDLSLREAPLHRLDHSAKRFDLLEVAVGRLLHAIRQRLHEITAAERVDRA